MKYFSIILILLFTPTLVAQSDHENDSIPFFSKAQIEEKLKNKIINSPEKLISFMCCMNHPVSYICPKCGRNTLYTSPNWDWLSNFGKQEFIWNNNGYFEPKYEQEREKAHKYVAHEIRQSREEIPKIKGIHTTLDESEFCKNCSPFIVNPTLYLLTNIEGESCTTKIANISYYDIQLLREFLENNTMISYEEDNNRRNWNKNGIDWNGLRIDENRAKAIERSDRIKELLGIP
jgi:hypothetical protein